MKSRLQKKEKKHPGAAIGSLDSCTKYLMMNGLSRKNSYQNFIPAITGGYICSEHDQILLSLLTRFGELGITIFYEIVCFEYENLRKLTSCSELIKEQSLMYSSTIFGKKNKDIVRSFGMFH